jgi:hypothetical protein
MAKSQSNPGSSFSTSNVKKATTTGTATPAPTAAAHKFATVNFTVTGVPSAYTDAATAAKHLVFKVVPLAADATSAPATPPVPPFGKGGKGAPAGAPSGAPSFGGDNDGDGPGAGIGHGKGHGPKGNSGGGAWTPSGTTPAPSATGTPAAGAPGFGGGDNDGDGPGAGFGHGGKGRGPGFGHGPQITNLVLSNGTLTGTISVPAGRTAGVEKFAVYPTVVADSANNVAAKTGTPVLLTVTTAADGTATVATSAAISVSFN